MENIISLNLVFTILSILLTGKNPPDEIKVSAKLKELNDRILKILNRINIIIVKFSKGLEDFFYFFLYTLEEKMLFLNFIRIS